jgi:hypothetical protein
MHVFFFSIYCNPWWWRNADQRCSNKWFISDYRNWNKIARLVGLNDNNRTVTRGVHNYLNDDLKRRMRNYSINYTSQHNVPRKVYSFFNVPFHAESKYAIKIFPSPTVFVRWHFLILIFRNFSHFLKCFFFYMKKIF